MLKNIAGQKLTLYAVDAGTGLPKTGDAANMVFYASQDDSSYAAIASNSGVPTEDDSTHAQGLYSILLSQAETNGLKLKFSGKSTTSNVVVMPAVIYTVTTITISGAGAVQVNLTITNDSQIPIAQCKCWVTTDQAGTNVVAGTIITDNFGNISFMLDHGTYYLWQAKSGFNFINPQTLVV